jgi:hypothetical protein
MYVKQTDTFCVVWDSSVSISTRYGLDDLGIKFWWQARFSAPKQNGPGAHTDSYKIGIPDKAMEHGLNHPPISSTKVKEKVELYVYSPSGASWNVLRYISFTSA